MTQEPFRHSPGVFADLAGVFRSISDIFAWLGQAASKILFVRAIAPFFYNLDWWAWEAAIKLSLLDTWASDTWTAIGEKLRPDAIVDALNDFAHEVYLLQLDPVDWFKYLTWRISDQLGWFVYDPVQWLGGRVKDTFPTLWAFASDPRQYILDRLQETHLELYAFALDPLGWIETNVGDVLLAVRWFLTDPYHFVHWQLLKLNSPLAPFWADPWYTILTEIGDHAGLPAQWWLDWPDCVVDLATEKAEEYYERYRDRVYFLAEHVLRFMWEGVW